MRSLVLYISLLIMGILCLRFISHRSAIVEQGISYAVYPLVVIEQACIDPIKNYYTKHRLMSQVIDLYTALVQDNNILRAENNKLTALVAQARCFDELLEFKQRYRSCILIPAHIILKHIDEDQHFFLIDKGSKHGIKPDMVVVYKNALMGRIIEVNPWFSKVLAITDRRCKIPALCCTSNIPAIHEGRQENLTQLTLVSHLEQPITGDLIISRGEGLIYPKGFALGRIIACEKNGLHYTIVVQPEIDLLAVETCYITHRESEYIQTEKLY